MKYNVCPYLSEGIEFRYNAIALCNRVAHEGGGDIVVEFYDDSNPQSFSFNAKKYKEKRNEVILANQTSDVYPKCKGCIEFDYFRNREIEKLKISNIVLHHWTKCNSNCIYCYSNKNKEYFNKRKSYKFLPILKNLIKDNLIAYGGIVNWAGGEVSCLDEFETVLEIFDKYDYFSIFNSSGIQYEQCIARHLSQQNGLLIISLDSGKKETHERIKNVKSYSIVWNNIEKYINNATNKAFVYLKYIILPNINDNENEITLFLEKAKLIGVEQVIFDIDLYYFKENRNNINERIIKLYYFAKNKCKELGLTFLLYQNAAVLFSEGPWKDDEMKKTIFGFSKNDKVKTSKALYMINKQGKYLKFESITQASLINKIEYKKIHKNCLQNSIKKTKYIKDRIFIYANEIEDNGIINKDKIKKLIQNKHTNFFNKFLKLFT